MSRKEQAFFTNQLLRLTTICTEYSRESNQIKSNVISLSRKMCRSMRQPILFPILKHDMANELTLSHPNQSSSKVPNQKDYCFPQTNSISTQLTSTQA